MTNLIRLIEFWRLLGQKSVVKGDIIVQNVSMDDLNVSLKYIVVIIDLGLKNRGDNALPQV